MALLVIVVAGLASLIVGLSICSVRALIIGMTLVSIALVVTGVALWISLPEPLGLLGACYMAFLACGRFWRVWRFARASHDTGGMRDGTS
jgi:hypothetical protein